MPRFAPVINAMRAGLSDIFDPVLLAVLLVRHMFHPVHGFSVETFLNGNVGHGCVWCGAVPMLFTRREPDHVTGPDLFDRSTCALRPAATRNHDQRLPKRMRMPCGASTRLKS